MVEILENDIIITDDGREYIALEINYGGYNDTFLKGTLYAWNVTDGSNILDLRARLEEILKTKKALQDGVSFAECPTTIDDYKPFIKEVIPYKKKLREDKLKEILDK